MLYRSTRTIQGYHRGIPILAIFSYALATCLKKQGNESWKEQANKALAILEKTTAVPNHNLDHDMIKKKVEELLEQRNGDSHVVE